MSMAPRPRPPGCLSDFVLDQLVARDLAGTPGEVAARRHLAECQRCSQRLAAFEAVEAPPFAELVREPSEAPRARVKSFAITLTAAALAAGIALYASSRNDDDPSTALQVTRAKGALALGVVLQQGEGQITRLSPEGNVSPGDSLRFELSSADSGFAGVVGVDSAGVVTPYAPGEGSLRAIAGGRPVLLEETIVADDTLGPERLIAVICEEALPVTELVASAKRALAAASGDPKRVARLLESCAEARFDFEKRTGETR